MTRQKRPTNWPRCLCGVAIYFQGDRFDMTSYEAFSRKVHICDYTESARRDREEMAARALEQDGAA